MRMESSHRIENPGTQPSVGQSFSGPIAFHNQLALEWEANYRSKAFLSRVEAFEGALEGRDLRGERWLDAGCGSGTLSRWLVMKGAEVVGVDGAPEMVRAAEESTAISALQGSLRFQVANVEALPFPDGSFDGVLCSSVLEYAENPGFYLNEIARVTKATGTLLISVPNAQSIVRLGLRTVFRLTQLLGRPRPQYMAHSLHQYSRAKFARLLRSHGFAVDYSAVFGSGMPDWLRGRSWYGRLWLFRAGKANLNRSMPRETPNQSTGCVTEAEAHSVAAICGTAEAES
jgi:ubiquinone/menaquinone biosynthesis C-methylase UbiE